MTTSGEQQAEGPAWPTPDDPAFANSGEQTREWLRATQPEALEANLAETVDDAFHALSRLAMFYASYPKAALDNVIAQLPPERSEVFKEQLEFAREYSERSHATRDEEGNLETGLFDLAMKSLQARRPAQV